MNGKTDIKRYVDIFAISGGVPDDEVIGQVMCSVHEASKP